MLPGHLRHLVHDGDVRVVALHFLVVLGDVSNDVLDLHVLSSVGAAELGRLVVLLELQEVRLDVVLRLGNVQVLVLAEDGVVEGDVEVLALLRGYFFMLVIDVVGIGKHGQVVKVADDRTDQIDLAVHQQQPNVSLLLLC